MDSRSKLITKEKDEAMRIDHDALRQVLIRPEIGDSPIAIMSIAGSMRTGKSFLMNFVERYLRNKGWENPNWMGDDSTCAHVEKGTGIFFWKGGTNRTTTGVRMSNTVFKIPTKDGREVAVLLMDTQGLFDHETPEDMNVTLLTLSTLMSSVQIFNVMGQLNSQNLSYLKTCVDFAMATAQEKEPYFMLQDLVFLIRDFPENEDDDDDDELDSARGFEYGEQYLKKIIDSKAGDKKQIVIRERIKKSFSTVTCFAMPSPGEKAKKKGFEGRNNELSKEFHTNVKVLVEEIAHPDRLLAKVAKQRPLGKEMTGREILNMIAACDNIFAMKMFKAHDVMEANIKAHYASEYEEAIREYDKFMKDQFDGSKAVRKESLRQRHNEAKKRAFTRFGTAQERGDGEVKRFYHKHLENTCEDHYKTAVDCNDAKHRELEAKKTKKATEVYEKYEYLMRKDSAAGSVNEDALLERHSRLLQDALNKYRGRINEELLIEKAKHFITRLLNIKKERQRMEQEIGQEKRNRELYEVTVRLEEKCRNKWKEKLKKHTSEEKLLKERENVRQETLQDYYKSVLTRDEDKYVRRLNDGMNENYNNAKAVLRKQQKVFVQDVPEKIDLKSFSRMKISEDQIEERRCFENYVEVLEKYAQALNQDIVEKVTIETLKRLKRQKQNEHRQIYYCKCSEHIQKYFLEIENKLIELFNEAKAVNEEKWQVIRDQMTALLDSVLLQNKRDLEQQMTDQYIEEEELANYFNDLRKILVENFGTTLPCMWSSFEVEEVKKIALEKFETLRRQIEEKNRSNRDIRPVKAADVSRSSKKFWQTLAEIIKKFFHSLHG